MPRPVRRRLELRFRVQALGTRRGCLPSLALTSTVPSRSQSASAVPKALRPLPKRPPTLQAFRSVLSRTSLVSTRKRSTVPFHTPAATGFNSGEQEKYTIFSCRCAGESVSRSANRPIAQSAALLIQNAKLLRFHPGFLTQFWLIWRGVSDTSRQVEAERESWRGVSDTSRQLESVTEAGRAAR